MSTALRAGLSSLPPPDEFLNLNPRPGFLGSEFVKHESLSSRRRPRLAFTPIHGLHSEVSAAGPGLTRTGHLAFIVPGARNFRGAGEHQRSCWRRRRLRSKLEKWHKR